MTPLDTITLYTTPSLCGIIYLNGQPYAPPSTGDTVQLLNDTNYTLGESGCGGFSFSGWSPDGPFTILGNNIVLSGNGSLTATFVSSASAFTIIFATNPSNCGGVLFQGAGYTEGQTLAEADRVVRDRARPLLSLGLPLVVDLGEHALGLGLDADALRLGDAHRDEPCAHHRDHRHEPVGTAGT